MGSFQTSIFSAQLCERVGWGCEGRDARTVRGGVGEHKRAGEPRRERGPEMTRGPEMLHMIPRNRHHASMPLIPQKSALLMHREANGAAAFADRRGRMRFADDPKCGVDSTEHDINFTFEIALWRTTPHLGSSALRTHHLLSIVYCLEVSLSTTSP